MRTGATVLDVGAGTGASLPLLVSTVGRHGHVVAVEQSQAMLDLAQRRAEDQGWSSIDFVRAAAQDVQDLPLADGALFFLTHDILQSAAAVTRVMEFVKDDGRVAAFGARASGPPLLQNLMRRLTARFVTTLDGLDAPWKHLTAMLEGVEIESLAMGQAYLATGTRGKRPT